MALSVLRQSSLGRKLRMVQVPLESPPRMAARWDMLLSPGTLNSAWSLEMAVTRNSDMGGGRNGLTGWVEQIAAMFGGGQPLSSRFLVGGFENGEDFAEVGDGFAQRAEQRLAVFDEDFRPHLRVSGGDAGGVAQAAAAEAAFGRVLQANARGAGGDDVRQVADPGDQFVVGRGAHPGGAAADALPEAFQAPRLVRAARCSSLVSRQAAFWNKSAVTAARPLRSEPAIGWLPMKSMPRPASSGGMLWCGRAFHAADVGDQAAGGQAGIQGLGNECGHRADRHGEHEQIRVRRRLPRDRWWRRGCRVSRAASTVSWLARPEPDAGGRSSAASARASEPPSRPPPRMVMFGKSALIRKKPGPVGRTRSVFLKWVCRESGDSQGTRKYFFSAAG